MKFRPQFAITATVALLSASAHAPAPGQASAREVDDTFTPMLRADGRPRPELFGPDSLHMSRAGYALWREVIAPVIH